MSRLVGIDVRSGVIRVAILRTSYRGVSLESLLEFDVAAFDDVQQALKVLVLPHLHPGDSVAAALDGQRVFVRRVELPAAAAKQLEEVLPFELEALLPIDFEQLVFDYAELERGSTGEAIQTLAVAARSSDVTSVIDDIEGALLRQPERVGAGAFPLVNLTSLCPELLEAGPIALVDFAENNSDLLVLQSGRPVYARTASAGIAGLPETAEQLVGALRQTFGGFVTQSGVAIGRLYLVGGGATAPGAAAYLGHELGIDVVVLPALGFEPRSHESIERTAQFAKAIGLALGLKAAPQDMDLRQGPLAFQRGYGFLKQKAPTIAAVVSLLVISFLLSTWTESRALAQENRVLSETLESLTQDLLGRAVSDAETANQLLDRGGLTSEVDPRPKVDAFDVMVALAEAVPEDVVHDVDELDMARGQVKIVGVLGSTKEAETVAENLRTRACFSDVKITRVTQAVNSERQKYVLELDAKCEKPTGKRGDSGAKGGE